MDAAMLHMLIVCFYHEIEVFSVNKHNTNNERLIGWAVGWLFTVMHAIV